MVDFDHGADCNDYLIPRGEPNFCILHIWSYKSDYCMGCQMDEHICHKRFPMIIPKPKFHGSDPFQ